ncbi:MAG: type IV pilus assembly protein PilM [Patescibacteria group bacterium]
MDLKNIFFSNIYKGNSAFGLDISDFSIKIVKIKKRGNAFEFENYNRVSIPKGVIKEGEIIKQEILTELLKKAVKESKFGSIRTPFAVCSLPEQHAFVKVIKLPKMNKQEAREAIKWEAEANIPLSLDEVYLDWKIINDTDVLINAVPKVLVNKYLQAITLAGIEPVIFEIESNATARSLIEKEKDPVLIIDLGFSRTSFIIFAKGDVRFTSSISISNEQMIKEIAKKLDIDETKAKQLKFEIGLKENGKIFNALIPSINKLIKKIQDCIGFYEDSNQKEPEYCGNISKIILCGGGANLYGIKEYMFERLKIPIVLGDPWINILDHKKKNKIPGIPFKESLAYSTALGLSIRGVL